MMTIQSKMFRSRQVVLAMAAVLMGAGLLLTPRMVEGADGATGEQIYRQRCAWCHGKNGQGTDLNYPRALVGDKSVDQLTRLIDKTMPDDAPEECVGEDAEKVAAYIYDAFYSPIAQARNAPPRIALARLTVRQYRNAVMDLIGTFREPGEWGDERGLKGEYFNSRRFRGDRRVLERVDDEVRFDFGTKGPGPDPEKFEPNEFSIRWEGSVLAPETGDYEFIVRTDHAARLWVNDEDVPLIDAWVKSGDMTEYRESIFLIGGRPYPVRLEFSKATQGVDKDKEGEPEKIEASIALEWVRPRHVAEVIPERHLSPGRSPERFIVETPFPPDDRSIGYERGTSVSEAWERATTDAAIEVASYIEDHLRELSGVSKDADDRKDRLQEFCLRFAERAFRRPLTDEQKQLYIHQQFEDAPDLESALKRVVLLVLKSPRFLYHDIDGTLDSYDVASRISFGLWDSIPDQPLLDAAASGELTTREQVAEQADRMIADLRTRSKLREFFHHWLKLDHNPDVAKDPERFPEFDETIVSDLRTSLDLFLDEVVWNDEASDFRRLLLADSLILNGRLARFYGADLPADAPFQSVALDPEQRAGVLTHPYVMANFAYTDTSSPIHRGVFLARSVLGRTLRPPPAAFAPLAPDLHPDLTTRERVALQTKPESCMACHGMINPLGFSLEHFDAIGRYRTEEMGKPIDSTGFYESRSGDRIEFDGARELANKLVDNEEVYDAFVEQLFHHLVKQPALAFGTDTLPDLRGSFVEQDFNIRSLMVNIIAETALTGREETALSDRKTTASPTRSE